MKPALDLIFASAGGRTVVTRRRYRWPLLIGRVFSDPAQPQVATVTIQNAAGTVIPGDRVAQRIGVVDGGSVVVRGQGATTVSGVPGGVPATDEVDIRVDGHSAVVFDPSPRILTPHAHYRQRTRVCMAPGARAVLVDAVVLHPDLTDDNVGSHESVVEVRGDGAALLALDAQLLEVMPRVRRAPTAFATVYVLGAQSALSTADVESLTALTGNRRVYTGVSELPNAAGWAVRIAAWDGGTLRTTSNAVLAQLLPHRSAVLE